MGRINNLILASGLTEKGFGSKSYAGEVYGAIVVLVICGFLLFGAIVINKHKETNGKSKVFYYEYAIPISISSALMTDSVKVPFISSEIIMYGILLVTLVVAIMKLGAKLGIAVYSWQFIFGYLIGFTAIKSIIIYLVIVVLIVGLKRYFIKKKDNC